MTARFFQAKKKSMEITLRKRDIDAIAYAVALILDKRQAERERKSEVPEMVPTTEAARILGITPGRMRQIADKYPHTKRGDNKQGKLMFVKSELLV